MADDQFPTDELTPLQAAFCREYLVDLNAAAAAVRAGYSSKGARQTGHALLQQPAVRERVRELQARRARRLDIDADYVLATLADTIERCRQAMPVRDGRGRIIPGQWEFDAGAVIKGLELLGKHLKLFTDRVEHSGGITLEALVTGARPQQVASEPAPPALEELQPPEPEDPLDGEPEA